MQTVLTTIGLLLNFICVSHLVKYKRNYGADEITWKRLKEYLGNTYGLFVGSIVGMFLIVIGLNWGALIQIFLS